MVPIKAGRANSPHPTLPINGMGGQGNAAVDLDKRQQAQVYGLGICTFQGPQIVGQPLQTVPVPADQNRSGPFEVLEIAEMKVHCQLNHLDCGPRIRRHCLAANCLHMVSSMYSQSSRMPSGTAKSYLAIPPEEERT